MADSFIIFGGSYVATDEQIVVIPAIGSVKMHTLKTGATALPPATSVEDALGTEQDLNFAAVGVPIALNTLTVPPTAKRCVLFLPSGSMALYAYTDDGSSIPDADSRLMTNNGSMQSTTSVPSLALINKMSLILLNANGDTLPTTIKVQFYGD